MNKILATCCFFGVFSKPLSEETVNFLRSGVLFKNESSAKQDRIANDIAFMLKQNIFDDPNEEEYLDLLIKKIEPDLGNAVIRSLVIGPTDQDLIYTHRCLKHRYPTFVSNFYLSNGAVKHTAELIRWIEIRTDFFYLDKLIKQIEGLILKIKNDARHYMRPIWFDPRSRETETQFTADPSLSKTMPLCEDCVKVFDWLRIYNNTIKSPSTTYDELITYLKTTLKNAEKIEKFFRLSREYKEKSDKLRELEGELFVMLTAKSIHDSNDDYNIRKSLIESIESKIEEVKRALSEIRSFHTKPAPVAAAAS